MKQDIERAWIKRNGKVYYRWRFIGQKKWNYKLTGYTELPAV